MKWCWLYILLLGSHFSDAQNISTFAGGCATCGTIGDGGPATAAIVNDPNGGVFDKHGNFYFTENLGDRVRKVDAAGIITTVAGTGSRGSSGDGGPATAALLNQPSGVTLDTLGNIYISELGGNRVRKVDRTTGIISTIAGNGTGAFYGDGIPATEAEIWGTQDICIDRKGNLYIADETNERVRKINTMGIISTFAGTGGFSSFGTGDGGPATAATFNFIFGLTADDTGNIYIADDGAVKVRKVDTAGIITTMAGNGTGTYGGDDIPATDAQIAPAKLAIDGLGELVIADEYNLRIYKVDNAGIIHNIVGNGIATYAGDGGPATAASIYYPAGVSYDPCGNLYIADVNNVRVRKVTYNVGAPITITINSSTSDTLCAGTPITFTSSITGGGISPTYQWYVNGAAAGTGSSYTYTPANGDVVNCRLFSSSPCSAVPDTLSNSITLVVYPPVPTIAITASHDTVCAGSTVMYASTVTGSGTSPAYLWYVNGAPAGTGSSYSYIPASGDVVQCRFTSGNPCATVPDTLSNTITMTVNPPDTATITITAHPGDTVCAGTSVAFATATTGGGTSPAYQWYVDGAATGMGSTYAYSPLTGDVVTCRLTTSAACATVPDTLSNTITMTVNPPDTATIVITAHPGDTVCAGDSVTYTSATTGAGTSPVYEWFINGIPYATGSSMAYVPTDHDVVQCRLTADATCVVDTNTLSNAITMTVNPVDTPTIAITGTDTVNIGSIATCIATVTGAGSSYTITWYNDGTLFATTTTTTTTDTVTYTKGAGTDTITALVVPNGPGCWDSATASILYIVGIPPMGITGINNTGSVRLYPNPATTTLTITSSTQINKITLTNLIGQTVFEETYNAEKAELNIGRLPDGVYMVAVTDEDGNKVVRRVVKE